LADIPDNILIGCKKGKGNDQRKLYDLLSPEMYGLCLRYAKNTDDAKDIMQEGFIKVFQKIEQYTKKGSLEGWIKRIMINTALEKYRSHVIMQSVDEKTATKNDLVYEETIQNISADDIISIIQTLTPKYRMVFNLYAIEGYSHKEIAEKLGISEGTSKSNLSRARTILQEKVNELFYVSGEKIK
jgi:RNA polymerase sigma factor (sigma-70 family)